MFKHLFLQDQGHGPRPEPVPPEPLQPDSSLFVPDGRLGLLLQDGKPDRWLQPGRHQLDAPKAKVEVRLISSELVRGQRFDQASDLPFERVFLFAEGQRVAIVVPGHQAGGAFAPRVSQLQEGPCDAGSTVPDEDDDPVLDFSFV